MIKYIFVILHVITAAGWFGMGLLMARISREAAAAPGKAVHAVGSRAVSLMGVFAVLTFLFGTTAFLLGGGFAVYGPEYHTSLLLVLILVAVQFLMIGPGWKALVGASDAGASGAARKRIAMGTGIGHFIWLVVLVLMFWRYLGA